MPQSYQKTYDAAVLRDLIEWFQVRFDHLPTELELSNSMRVFDLRHTVELYIELINKHGDSQMYGGQILHLFRIREALQAAGME